MQKRSTTLTVSITIAVVILGIAIFWSTQDKKQSVTNTGTAEQDVIKDAQRELKTNGAIYQGDLISGISAPYLVFNKVDYDQALAEGKIIFLDFYANWCPICRAEAPEIQAGFDELTTDQVVGFRVNYKDDETDSDEKVLAEQFDIPYQHTKVILKNGQEVSRSGESWDEEMFLEEINKVL